MSNQARLRSRVASWFWDYLVILAWLVLLFVAVGLPQLLGWWDLAEIWDEQWVSDVVITVLTVIPYFAYLVISEVRDPYATWGKRRAALRVVDRTGSAPASAGVVVRNLIKVLPWQLGHMGAVRLITTSGASQIGIWLGTAAMAVLALIVAPVLFGRPGAHDLLAGTRVVSRTQGSYPR